MGGKAAVILVIGFGIILSKMAFHMNHLETRAVENVSRYLEATISHNLALAGTNVALSKLYQNPNLRGRIDSVSLTSGPFAGGTYTARLDSINPNLLRLRTISVYKGMRDTVEVSFRTRVNQSFSMFQWMTNFEGNVDWRTGDTVWGRVHSNGNIHINGSPVFWEKVTTAKGFNPPRPGIGTNHAIFKKGYETGVAHIQFPTDLSQLLGASTAGGRRYTRSIWVSMAAGTAANGDGKLYVRHSAAGPVIDSVSLSDPSFNGVLVGENNVHVHGRLDGRLTIASLRMIFIEDDVLYERNPLTGDSDDMLGLVAEQGILVADNAANNNNCEIHGAIFVRAGSFGAQNFNTRPVSGVLRVVGSIVQDTRGAVGRFSGSTIRSGFSKRYHYDPRFVDPNVRPPHFPGFYTQTLQISGWWESYRLPRF